MKKQIIHNDITLYEVEYIISKNKYAIYSYYKLNKEKMLIFFNKDGYPHRPCNIGKQGRGSKIMSYVENTKLHNLYGPAFLDKRNNNKEYHIYGNKYTLQQFYNYLLIYNNLSYKRIY